MGAGEAGTGAGGGVGVGPLSRMLSGTFQGLTGDHRGLTPGEQPAAGERRGRQASEDRE